VGFAASQAAREEEGDAPEPGRPLVNSEARNSKVDSKRVVWPQTLTPGNSGPSGLKAMSPLHVRARVMFRILGAAVCNLYLRTAPGDFVMRSVYCKVLVGWYRYGLKEREDVIEETEDEESRLNRLNGKTRASWFKMLASDVPHYVRDPELGPVVGINGAPHYLYGRIHRFAQLNVPAWRAEPFLLAKVRLYKLSGQPNHMGLSIIHTHEPLQYMFEGNLENIEYVQVKDLVAQIAVAPVRIQQHGPPSSSFYVLDIDN
jgi:hypothetical protein